MKVPPGTYLGDVTQMYLSQTPTTNNPFLAVEFGVGHVAQNGQWVPIQPETRTVRFFLTDKAVDFSLNKLRALGFNGDFANPKCSITEGVTLVCEAQAGTGANAGKTYESWSVYSEHQEAERIPVPADAVRQMNARWKSKFGAPAPTRVAPPALPARQAPARQAAPVVPDAAPVAEEDDYGQGQPGDNIPF